MRRVCGGDDCEESAPICVDHACVECEEHADCDGVSASRCETNACVGCEEDGRLRALEREMRMLRWRRMRGRDAGLRAEPGVRGF